MTAALGRRCETLWSSRSTSRCPGPLSTSSSLKVSLQMTGDRTVSCRRPNSRLVDTNPWCTHSSKYWSNTSALGLTESRRLKRTVCPPTIWAKQPCRGLNDIAFHRKPISELRSVTRRKKVSICIAHLAYNASNALFVTNPSRQPHGHHVQTADTG